MADARFAYDNFVTASGTTITASSEVTNRPDDYLASPARWKKWRSLTSTSDVNVVFDFGASKSITAVLLVDWKAHTGGTIKAEYWDGSTWKAFGTFTLPTFNPTKVVALWKTTAVATQKIRIYFTNTNSVDEYVELGVVFAGSYYQPSFHLAEGWAVTQEDPSIIVAADGGQEQSQARTIYHTAKGTFAFEPGTDLTSFRTLFAAVGKRLPFCCAIDPDDADQIFYGRLTDLPYQHVADDNWTLSLSIQEVR